KDLIGTKFWETFYLRRPMIHVGDPGVISEYIVQHRVGTTIPVEDLGTELPKIMRGERSIAIDPNYDVSPHLLEHITDELERKVLNSAVL
ncbi:MAG TPA: hypothetical protein VHL57_03705, partial [Flavobacteriales bacterium]|nr:hypothetical protein [Flavobacteriales bacterium]